MEIKDDPSVIEPLLSKLRKNFLAGGTHDLKFRKTQLKKLLKGIHDLTDDLYKGLSKDLSKSSFDSSLTEVNPTVAEVEHALNHFEEWAKPVSVDTPMLLLPSSSSYMKEPLGVVLVMGAWNYPIFETLTYLASAIASGNACIIKSSEMSPFTTKVITRIVREYLDRRYYDVVEGGVQVSIALTKAKFDHIVFTGSTAKGKLVAKAAAENLVPCTLELGGKCPVIIDESADIDNACLRIAQAKFVMNNGQVCLSADHLFIHEKIKDKFLKHFVETVNKFFKSNVERSVDYSRIINDFHTKRLAAMLSENHGGKPILSGPVKIEEKFIHPHVIWEPRRDSLMMQEEIFGPILPCFSFGDIDSLIREIQSLDKPLALYYFGAAGKTNEMKVRTLTSSGAYSVNEVSATS